MLEAVRRGLFFLALFVATSIFAGPKDGFYVGLGGGASFDQVRFQARNTATGLRVRRRTSETHGLGSAFIGYGHTFCNCFFLGIEGGTYFPRRTLSQTRPGVSVIALSFRNHLAIQDYFTADLLAGYRLSSCFLFYVRGGLSVAHQNLKQDRISMENIPGFSESSMNVGGRVGLGIHYSIFRNLSLGADYFYTLYPKMCVRVPEFDTAVHARVRANYIGLSLTYSFPICR